MHGPRTFYLVQLRTVISTGNKLTICGGHSDHTTTSTRIIKMNGSNKKKLRSGKTCLGLVWLAQAVSSLGGLITLSQWIKDRFKPNRESIRYGQGNL